ncbi:S8 family peptidase [Parageobacillus toebii]|uniref:Subtilisin DY n=1 Tax=Parageobacillus toebii TaxID=153151 RepID=A0A150MT18_9BACL|nr:S8 family peptidase [Parageobacillus toebii]KYD27492.1 Subtilisin DY [Parageobacillus toebii]
MNNKMLLVIIMSLIFFTFNIPKTFADNNHEQRYFVTFKEEVDTDYIKEKEGKIIQQFNTSSSVLIEASSETIQRIKDNNEIVSIELDVEVEIDEAYETDWGLIDIDPQEQLIPWNIDYIGSTYAHQIDITGKNVKVGIIDSGINPHKDLKVSGGINIVGNNGNYYDDYGHGTKVAGIIAALDNSYGIIGVAPDVELYSIKVLKSNGKGSISDVVAGIEWAIENDIDILNFSLQTTIDNSVLRNAIQKAYENNILLVASAGNMGGTKKVDTVTYPAAYDEVIAVAAVDKNGERASYSSTGKRIDISAPGDYVYTTVQSGLYFLATGTSMAAPHVSGVAALVLECQPNLDVEELRKILLKSKKPFGNPKLYGKGIIDVPKAIKFSKN